eukprot:2422631-Pleurochrysis_carterae.AAC.1
MNKLFLQLQRQLLPVLLLDIYGAEPHMNHGIRLLHPDTAQSPIYNMVSSIVTIGTKAHAKHSCRSDISNGVVGAIPDIPPSV